MVSFCIYDLFVRALRQFFYIFKTCCNHFIVIIKYMIKHLLLFPAFLAAATLPAGAWSGHHMLSRPALEDLDLWQRKDSVEAVSLRSFLLETEEALAAFLDNQEAWSRKHLPHYVPRPEELAFDAAKNEEDILLRFIYAIRINPESRIPLYLQLLPGEPAGDRERIAPSKVSIWGEDNAEGEEAFSFVRVRPGEQLHPLDVLVTANDEPDYGFDIGLFEDNQTAHGRKYGFDRQPFGNPELAYSSQAPFHMGFYHESRIVYVFGSFLNKTFLDYRVHLFRDLSRFAFDQGQPYWGWRFLGWSMHYAGDITMPWHSRPLPGYSTLRMLWVNFKAMLGFTRSRDEAIQLSSNRHIAMEAYQRQEVRNAWIHQQKDHPFFQALRNPYPPVPFTREFVREEASKGAARQAKHLDRVVRDVLPHEMVDDPGIEVTRLRSLGRVAEIIREQQGEAGAAELNKAIAERFRDYSMSLRSVLFSVIEE